MRLLFILLLFVFATFSHAGVLIFARRHPQMHESARQHLWRTHLWVNGIMWGALFLWMIVAQFSFPRTLDVPLLLKLIGIFLAIAGIVMILAVSFVLNFKNMMGLRFFYPTKAKRVYSYFYHILNNPMYDGFFLILMGLALRLGIVEDFYLALVSFFLLNIILATIENYEFKLNPF